MSLNNVKLSELFFSTDTNTAVERFYNVVYAILNKYVPIFQLSNTKFPRWFDGNLRKLIKEKRLTRKHYKINLSPSTYLYFSELRVKCK